MRKLPNRQAEAVLRFRADFTFILYLLPDIDLQPTPELCGAIRGYLQRYLAQARANRDQPMDFVSAQMEECIPSLGWIARHCDCNAELDDLDRKSTRLNSSHLGNSYGGFCLKKEMGNNGLVLLDIESDQLFQCRGCVPLV